MIAVALVVATVLLGVAVMAAAGHVRARVEAQHGADAAALAGAFAARAAVAQGADAQEAGCGAAREAGGLVGVQVDRCAAVGAVVTVAVRVTGQDAVVIAVAGPRHAVARRRGEDPEAARLRGSRRPRELTSRISMKATRSWRHPAIRHRSGEW